MSRRHRAGARAAWPSLAGAAAIVVGGALHVGLAVDRYGTPDLVTLFLLNGIGSALVAAWIAYDRRPFPLLAGLALSSVSLLAFALSRTAHGVVGFRGAGLEPAPDSALILGVEIVAAVLLGIGLIRSRHELAALLGPLVPRRRQGLPDRVG